MASGDDDREELVPTVSHCYLAGLSTTQLWDLSMDKVGVANRLPRWNSVRDALP